MKGSGETIKNILLIVVVIVIFSVLVADAFGQNIKRQRIVLEEIELFKVKNTFFLVNRSLAETWRLSTIQSVFYAGDVSVECGYDQKGESLRIGQKYWLRTPPNSGGTTNRISETGEPLIVSIAPKEDEKYNRMATPVICGPKRSHLNELLNRKMGDFTRTASFKSNDLDVDVRGVKSELKSFDEKIESRTQYELEVSAGGCANSVSCAKATTANVSGIDTGLAKMVDAGRAIVYEGGNIEVDDASGVTTGSLLGYSIAFLRSLIEPEFKTEFINPHYIQGFRYQDVAASSRGLIPTHSGGEYINMHRAIISSIIYTKKDMLKDADMQVSLSLELVAPCNSAFRTCEYGDVTIMRDGSGLVLHYDATITIRDKNRFYYFYNEKENRFEKRQVELQIKAEDYLPALDCLEPGISEKERIFIWEAPDKQLKCFQGLLYSCGDYGIKNFPRQSMNRC